jgi:hypothetical protein
VDQALQEFVQRSMEIPMTSQERSAIMGRGMTHDELIALQLPKIDFHDGRYGETINHSLSTQSLYLLDRLAELEIYGLLRKSALALWIMRSGNSSSVLALL